MKRKNVPLLVVALLLVAGSYFSCNNDNTQTSGSETIETLPTDSLFTPTGHAQLDSLLKLAATAKQDTNLAKIYNQIVDLYVNNDSEKQKEYLFKLKNLSDRLDWNQGRMLFYSSYSIHLAREGLADSALVIAVQGLELAKKNNNDTWTVSMYMNTGEIYNSKEWYETALRCYMDALPIAEKLNNTYLIGRLYDKISNLYSEIKMPEKAVEYSEKAVSLLADDSFALYRLGWAYINVRQYEKATAYLQKALDICVRNNDNYLQRYIYYLMTTISFYTFDLESAETYLNKLLELQGQVNDIYMHIGYLELLGKLEQLKGHFVESEKLYLQTLALADEWDILDTKKTCYLALAELAVAQRKFRENVTYLEELEFVEKAMATATTLRAAEEMAVKYETEKKEIRIAALEEERRLMVWLSMAIGAVLLMSLAAALFLWRMTVQKKHLSEQQHQLAEARIHQLEQEKQLIATQSVLDGETRERARLARDLHDGLGSLLTGTKLSLLEMKQGVKLDFADVKRFDTALGLLDDSVREMRRVAHHLMPDSLSRFGLKPAVSDFCNNLPAVQFSYYGDESRLEPNMEVMIYRTIHELVNNALKHAGATQIMVQLIREPDRIAFTVQDDGRGFDPAKTTEGMGIQNIRTRVASFNGIIDLDSRPGEGTEIHVELKI